MKRSIATFPTTLLKALLIIATCQFGALFSSGAVAEGAAKGNDHNALVRMFDWWNGAIKDPNGFTEEAFRRHFTEDAAIVINGVERI